MDDGLIRCPSCEQVIFCPICGNEMERCKDCENNLSPENVARIAFEHFKQAMAKIRESDEEGMYQFAFMKKNKTFVTFWDSRLLQVLGWQDFLKEIEND